MTPPSTLPEETPTSSKSTASTFSGSDKTPSRKTRENAQEKGRRLLVAGRLRVLRVDGDLIVATCRGDSGGIYDLGFDPGNRQWRCTCPARTACSHLHALWAVVALVRR